MELFDRETLLKRLKQNEDSKIYNIVENLLDDMPPMIQVGDNIGYIECYALDNGKYRYEYIERKINGFKFNTRSSEIIVKGFYNLDFEVVLNNTRIMRKDDDNMVICRPFFTNPEMAERCRRICEMIMER